MEMRMRAVESNVKTLTDMRDTVTELKADSRYIKRIVEELNAKLDKVMEEERSFRVRRG